MPQSPGRPNQIVLRKSPKFHGCPSWQMVKASRAPVVSAGHLVLVCVEALTVDGLTVLSAIPFERERNFGHLVAHVRRHQRSEGPYISSCNPLYSIVLDNVAEGIDWDIETIVVPASKVDASIAPSDAVMEGETDKFVSQSTILLAKC